MKTSQGAESLGPCCVCGGTAAVRTIICLGRKSPIPGRGWGCVVCGIASDGACAVVCDFCVELHGDQVPEKLVTACRGWPGVDGRVPIGELTGTHEHDMSRHEPGD